MFLIIAQKFLHQQREQALSNMCSALKKTRTKTPCSTSFSLEIFMFYQFKKEPKPRCNYTIYTFHMDLVCCFCKFSQISCKCCNVLQHIMKKEGMFPFEMKEF